MVGVRPATTVWTADILPLPSSRGLDGAPNPFCCVRHRAMNRSRTGKALAMSGAMHYAQVTWRDGSNAALSSCFACLRVCAAHRPHLSKSLRAEEWLSVSASGVVSFAFEDVHDTKCQRIGQEFEPPSPAFLAEKHVGCKSQGYGVLQQ